jgi:hypothetical protein
VPQGFGVQELGENGNVVQDIFDVNGDGLPTGSIAASTR